jgi:hypothetical protein
MLGVTLRSIDYLEAEIKLGILLAPIRGVRENPPMESIVLSNSDSAESVPKSCRGGPHGLGNRRCGFCPSPRKRLPESLS